MFVYVLVLGVARIKKNTWILIIYPLSIYVTGSGKIDHAGTRIKIPLIAELYSYTRALSRHHNRMAADSQVCFSRRLSHEPVEL